MMNKYGLWSFRTLTVSDPIKKSFRTLNIFRVRNDFGSETTCTLLKHPPGRIQSGKFMLTRS